MSFSKIIIQNSKSLSSAGAALHAFYTSNPKVASACVGSLTFCLGDIIAQSLERDKRQSEFRLDLKRSFQLGMLGVFINGVFMPHWYRALDKVLGSSAENLVNLGLKVVADQLVFAPFAMISFFYVSALRSASTWEAAFSSFCAKIKEEGASTYAADWLLWPMANCVNFRYVPLIYRPSFTAGVQLIWQTFMSIVARREVEPTVVVTATTIITTTS
mmetsp:Transcript_22334/g.37364  ORF Transcript_22334/g.37364 Transcript_22334/m.37364 type:complete len:216 (+) Transcript_22334:109-756(+)